ncbi:DMT family transporter [Pseudomonas gingeri]|uniref:DMT family transporter n=1 Tax=Pseudomonas gingeri TaxID=117681 RepID=UPI00159F7F5A|nr:DMT family transporter [Pseudomonas gingeri]NVZ27727.1 DMT family transporter [Pseudomonas gingeri]NVZ64164.1 DMT family transporter [Pseudomonas gingeri]NVZ73286.1 DMT family transporter [Pseudomonas gingeri]NWE70457.1 DMT family transporter [Pseudomonas gingeri]
MTRYINFLLLALMGSTWGLHFVLVKKITSVGVHADLILFPTLVGVAIAFLAMMVVTRSSWRTNRSWWVFLIICSVLGYAFPIWLELVVAPYIDSTLLTLIVTSTPVFCICLGFLLRLATVTFWHVLCAALGIGAAMMLLLPSAALPQGSSRFWLAVAIGVPVSYALYNLYVAAAWPKGLGVFTMAAYESVLAALLALPLFFTSTSEAGYQDLVQHGSEVALLVIVTAVEVWSFFELVRRAGGIYVSFASFAALAAGIAWSALLLDEQITPWMNVSIGAIVLSLVLCLIGDRSQTQRTSLG